MTKLDDLEIELRALWIAYDAVKDGDDDEAAHAASAAVNDCYRRIRNYLKAENEKVYGVKKR